MSTNDVFMHSMQTLQPNSVPQRTGTLQTSASGECGRGILLLPGGHGSLWERITQDNSQPTLWLLGLVMYGSGFLKSSYRPWRWELLVILNVTVCVWPVPGDPVAQLTSGTSAMEYTTTPWYWDVFSVILPRPDFSTWFP